ncbi:hypothetical protein P3X46_033751 [Hevea brasiliensis]|uniref:Retrotransposon gag domain-containing protein n=1 Tax=Hevea brasiliensis TaxID=3981 RepID=A0ABQ9KE56_HEVBR|nr:hypothetical protein P3X46_033751 [Hevea brasiliensis]
MIIALRAKDKLGFINGKCEMPSVDSPLFERWQRVDSMVVSWILNTISKEIVESFWFTAFAKDLWDELKQCFGESNGPLLFQIKKDICAFTQGNKSLMAYFTKLKKMWDKQSCLRPFPACTCGASKAVAAIESEDRLIVEKQREVQNVVIESSETTAVMLARSQNFKKNNFRDISGPANNFKPSFKEYGKEDERFCNNCNTGGRMRDSCFKLIGYPDWYKEL